MYYQTNQRRQVRQVVGLAAFLTTSTILGAAVGGVAASDAKKASAAHPVHRSGARAAMVFPQFVCGYRTPAEWIEGLRAAVARGEIRDPTMRAIPPIARGRARTALAGPPCLSSAHIFPFVDTNQLLLTDFSNGELIDLLTTGSPCSVLASNGQFVCQRTASLDYMLA